jgi:hypothetical protein
MARLGRNSGTLSLTTTSATQILGPNPNRVGLVISIASNAGAFISVDFGENAAAGRGIVVNSLAGPYTFTPDVFG